LPFVKNSGSMSKVKTIALIPARAGSKGVLNKNIRSLAGHPLVEWSIAACLRARTIDRVVVSTDSTQYAAMCRVMGAEVPFIRPSEISCDRSTDIEFIAHALDWFANDGGEPDLIVHIRPTTPYRDPALIDQAVAAFQVATDATALRSVHEMSESAYKTFEINAKGCLQGVGSDNTELDAANNARQQFPVTFSANGYVDVLSTVFIRQTGLLHGNAVMPFVTPRVTEVDCEDDFAFLEYEIARDPLLLRQLFD
jgi:CMP-N,N'-diacetyllegionaminic acid synthase